MRVSNKTEDEQMKNFVFLMLKHWYYFVISFAVCGIIGIIYYKNATPVMGVVARVTLRHDESLIKAPISGANSLMSAFGLGGGNENIEDESIKMNSQGYIKKVVQKLDLNKEYFIVENFGFIKKQMYNYPPIVLLVDSTVSDTISAGITFFLDIENDKTKVKIKANKKNIGNFEIITYPAVLKTAWGEFTIDKTPFFDMYEKPLDMEIRYMNYDYAAQIYRESLLIDYEKRTSDFINLSFNSENVFFAKKILNEVINTYNNEWDGEKNAVSEKTLAFIDERLKLTETLLLNADVQIKQFKDKYNLTTIEADVAYYLKFTAELQAQLLEAETQLNVANIIVDFVQDEKNKYSLIPFDLTLSNANMTDAINKYNEALTKRNELYKSNTQSSIVRSMDANINAQRTNMLVSLGNIKKELTIAQNNLRKKEREFGSKIGNVPTIEKDFIHLKREQELQQNIYIFLLEMREQTAVKSISLLPKLKTIDHPYVLKKKISPRLSYIALIVLILGMAIPLSVIYGIPFIRDARKKISEGIF
ncbi:MAG: hypothetical protein LBH32_00690 [Dysgonamonadaceae bacterium]|jgi:uncharacterized protein involved in exopolysaccharide biosynthesis|nr:hypothetical protein [Dysgonamonadaceae bacterium]